MDLTPDFNVTATIDGFAIRYGGKLVAEFPSWEGAVAGLKAAREALVMLDRVLSSEAPPLGCAGEAELSTLPGTNTLSEKED